MKISKIPLNHIKSNYDKLSILLSRFCPFFSTCLFAQIWATYYNTCISLCFLEGSIGMATWIHENCLRKIKPHVTSAGGDRLIGVSTHWRGCQKLVGRLQKERSQKQEITPMSKQMTHILARLPIPSIQPSTTYQTKSSSISNVFVSYWNS